MKSPFTLHCNICLNTDGSVFTWGSNDCGQLGFVAPKEIGSQLEPQPVTSLYGLAILCIAAGSNHNFALTISGALLGWGDNKLVMICC